MKPKVQNPVGNVGQKPQTDKKDWCKIEGCRIGPQTRSKKIEIPETSGINVLYPHVGVCRSFRICFYGASCLRSYSTSFISRRECPPSVHARNKRFVKRELRSRGIAITPESDPVVRLSPGSNWNKMDVKMVLRKTPKASYIPLCVCDFILENLHVIKQAPSVGHCTKVAHSTHPAKVARPILLNSPFMYAHQLVKDSPRIHHSELSRGHGLYHHIKATASFLVWHSAIMV